MQPTRSSLHFTFRICFLNFEKFARQFGLYFSLSLSHTQKKPKLSRKHKFCECFVCVSIGKIQNIILK